MAGDESFAPLTVRGAGRSIVRKAPAPDARAVSFLHIFPSFARGGQQMRLAAIGAALGSDYRHRIVSLDGDLSARAAFDGLNVAFEAFAAKKSRGISLSNLRIFRRLLYDHNPDILCTYNFGALEAAVANAMGPRLPHIHYEDGFGADETGERQFRRRVLMRRYLLRRSFLAVPSRALERIAVNDWGLAPGLVMRIPNGIDLDKFAVRPGRSARRPQDRAVTIGALGALRREKNFARLIRAFSYVAADRAKLLIYGDGPERDRLRALAERAGGDIALPGATEAPEEVYRLFDLFALSSDTEQMPLTLMEAMAAGLPVIATDVGDVKDMVTAENREFVTPAGDADAFAAALGTLVGNDALRARLGRANAAKARAAFGLDAMVAAHKALYAEAVRRAAS